MPAKTKTKTKRATPAPKKKAAPRKTKAAVKIEPVGPAPNELALALDDPSIARLADHVREAGGAPLAAYRDPLGGHPLLLASLPIERISPTSFQRDVSPAHVKKLARAIGKTRRFLDPVIAIREDDGRFLTPNDHRLTAMRELGARSIVTLLVPERAVAYQILALNIEKATCASARSKCAG